MKKTKSNMTKEFELKSALRAYADGGTVMTAANALRNRKEQIDGAVDKAVSAKPADAQPKKEAPKEPERVKPHPDYKPRGLLRNILGFQHGGEVKGPGGPRDDKVPAFDDDGDELRVSDGEYILPAATVQAVGGPKALDRLVLRTTGRQPGAKMVDGVPHAAMGEWIDPLKRGAFKVASVAQGAVDAGVDAAKAGWQAAKGAYSNAASNPTLRSTVGAVGNTVKSVGEKAWSDAGNLADEAGTALRGKVGPTVGAAQGAMEQVPGFKAPTAGIEVGDASMKDFREAKAAADPKGYGATIQRAADARRLNPTNVQFSSTGSLMGPEAVAPKPEVPMSRQAGRVVGSALRKLPGAGMGAVGRMALPVGVGLEAYNAKQDMDTPGMTAEDRTDRVVEGISRFGGAAGGAAFGAGLGSVAGPVGSVVGGLAGGTAGYFAPDAVMSLARRYGLTDKQMPSDKAEQLRAVGAPGSTPGTDVMANNVSGLRALDNAQMTPQPNVQETPAGPAGTGINRITGEGLRSPLYTNLPREEALAGMQGGTVNSFDMKADLRARAAENAIRQQSIDAQDARGKEEAKASRDRYIGYLESTAEPERDRFGRTAAERDLDMAKFRTDTGSKSSILRRKQDIDAAEKGLEEERKGTALRATQAQLMRKTDVDQYQAEEMAKSHQARTDAIRQNAATAAATAAARLKFDERKLTGEERKAADERNTKNADSLAKELATRYGLDAKDATPETRAQYNKSMDRIMFTLSQNNLSLGSLSAEQRNALFQAADEANAVDMDNSSFSNKFMELLGIRSPSGTSKNLRRYQPTGAEPGVWQDELLTEVGPVDADQYRYGNTDTFHFGQLPDVDRTAAYHELLRRRGR